jgi:hypothetical protein
LVPQAPTWFPAVRPVNPRRRKPSAQRPHLQVRPPARSQGLGSAEYPRQEPRKSHDTASQPLSVSTLRRRPGPRAIALLAGRRDRFERRLVYARSARISTKFNVIRVAQFGAKSSAFRAVCALLTTETSKKGGKDAPKNYSQLAAHSRHAFMPKSAGRTKIAIHPRDGSCVQRERCCRMTMIQQDVESSRRRRSMRMQFCTIDIVPLLRAGRLARRQTRHYWIWLSSIISPSNATAAWVRTPASYWLILYLTVILPRRYV